MTLLLAERLPDRVHAPHGRFRDRYALVVERRLVLARLRGFHHAAGIVVERDLPASVVGRWQHDGAVALLDPERVAWAQGRALDDRGRQAGGQAHHDGCAQEHEQADTYD